MSWLAYNILSAVFGAIFSYGAWTGRRVMGTIGFFLIAALILGGLAIGVDVPKTGGGW